MARFPRNVDDQDDGDENAAIQVFGRRFLKDQTPIEYLTEFFLVFASPKGELRADAYAFPDYGSEPLGALTYHPPYRLGLKLFAFLGGSKLETRHPVHISSFREGISEVERRIVPAGTISREDGVRLTQGLFSGFVGVAGDRTWTAHTFLPASSSLLAREILWKHAGEGGAARRHNLSWRQSWKYFNTSAHSFMARGGELLYLQLTSMFNADGSAVPAAFETNMAGTYAHFDGIDSTNELRVSLQQQLAALLNESDHAIGALGDFVEKAFQSAEVESEPDNPNEAVLGWVPRETAPEAFLFAWEAENICKAQRSGLQKISLLKDLCVLHVMRSLCFQSARVMELSPLREFVGGYSWVACAVDAAPRHTGKKAAINAYDGVESLLYRSLRAFDYSPGTVPSEEPKKQGWLDKGDDNTLRLFRKIGKQIGVIVPRKGQGMRITLPPHIVRLLVAALIPPGKRIRLDAFYQRIFGHYGIAISQETAEAGLSPYGIQHAADAFGVDSTWFEEELRRGGYLIPLSDAVSLVSNPYKGSM